MNRACLIIAGFLMTLVPTDGYPRPAASAEPSAVDVARAEPMKTGDLVQVDTPIPPGYGRNPMGGISRGDVGGHLGEPGHQVGNQVEAVSGHPVFVPQAVEAGEFDDLQQPLSVTIIGPSVSLRGDGAGFTAVITGQPAGIEWTVDRTDAINVGGLVKIEGSKGRQVNLNGQPGIYTIGVAVSGRNGAVASARWRHAIIDDRPPVEEQESGGPEPGPVAPVPQIQMAPPQPVDSLTPFIRNLVAAVGSPNRIAEAHAVGGSLRMTANQISTGTFTGSDPIVEAKRQAALALGQNAGAWTPFFYGIDVLVSALRQQGQAQSAAEVGSLLSAVASILSRVQ